MAFIVNNFWGAETQGQEEVESFTSASILGPAGGGGRGSDYCYLTNQSGSQIILNPFVDEATQGSGYVLGFGKYVTGNGSSTRIAVRDSVGGNILSLETGVGSSILNLYDSQVTSLDSYTMPSGSWIYVEVYFTAAGAWEWFVDGVSQGSGSGADFDTGNALTDVELTTPTVSGASCRWDDIYFASGATSAADRLNQPFVEPYRSTKASAAPDAWYSGQSSVSLTTGTWANAQELPFNATNEAAYEDNGTSARCFVYCDDSPSGGIPSDSTLATIHASKGVWRAYRNNGGGVAMHVLLGAKASGTTLGVTEEDNRQIDGSIDTTPAIFTLINSNEALPTTSEHILIGFGRDSGGGRDLFVTDMLAQILATKITIHPDAQIDANSYSVTGSAANLTASRKFLAETGTSFPTVGYFDASFSGPTDPQAIWTDDANAFDGQTSSFAYTTDLGVSGAKLLTAGGTTVAIPQDATFSLVECRAYMKVNNGADEIQAEWGFGGGTTGTQASSSTTGEWGSWITQSTPVGGWDQQKVEEGVVGFYRTIVGTDNISAFASEARVTFDQTYLITGSEAAFHKGYTLAVVAGSYALTGSDATLTYNTGVPDLEASPGSYALTGQAADLDLTVRLQASAGSYSLAGQNVDLLKGFTFQLDAGTFTLAGELADLDRTLAVLGDAGAYAWSGSDANLLRALRIAQAAGAYTLAGAQALLLTTKTLAAENGAYALTGEPADLDRGYQVDLEAGAFTLAGQPADLERGIYLAVDSGAYVLAGQLADLDRGYQVDLEAGSYALTGSDADFQLAGAFLAEAGSYTQAGQAAELLRALRIAQDTGTYTIAGAQATLALTRSLSAQAGTFSAAGQAVELVRALTLQSEAGGFSLTGSDANLGTAGELMAETGSYALTGSAASLQVTVQASAGSYALTGQATELLRGLRIAQAAGAYTLAGAQALLEAQRALSAQTGAFLVTGSAAELDKSATLAATAGSYALTGFNANLQALGSYILTADAGAFTLAGFQADLERALQLEAVAGSYALTGSAALLGQATSFAADGGAYTTIGQPAEALRSLRLAADTGTYTIAGADANIAAQKLLRAVEGAIQVIGQAADLDRGYYLALEAGSYALSGQDASLDYLTGFQAEIGAYQVQGQAALLILAGYDPLESSDRIQVRVDDLAIPIRVDDRITKIQI